MAIHRVAKKFDRASWDCADPSFIIDWRQQFFNDFAPNLVNQSWPNRYRELMETVTPAEFVDCLQLRLLEV